MKGIFTISIDYEGAWGYMDKRLTPTDFNRIRGEVEITKKLLVLFERYTIPVTWAVVGGLLEEGSHGKDSAWYDSENIVGAITTSSVGHEIGSHSFGHILFDSINRSTAEQDIKKARRVHIGNQLPFQTFVFPRNKEGHHAVLKESGITTFRGVNHTWYSRMPGMFQTLGRGIDYWLPTAHLVAPRVHATGLTDISDSMLFVSRRGIQKILPPFQLVRKIKYGIYKAAEKKKIFHLWFHPSNFSYDTDTQLRSLEKILAYASELRAGGHIKICPVGTCKEFYEEK